MLVRSAWLALAVFACLIATSPAIAGELSAFAGGVRAAGPGETSQAWAMEWTHAFSEHVALAGVWVNEGHVTDHHRDGGSLQGWLRSTLADPRLVVGVGVGPYAYFDTTRPENTPGSAVEDQHGWGFIYSLGASWDLGNAWLLQVRANYIDTRHSFDTTSVMIGAGYRFDGPVSAAFEVRPLNEVTMSPGISVANNFESQKGFAKAVEYRRALTQHFGVSTMWLDEGKSNAVRRNGIAVQLGLVYPLNTPNWTLGAALGPYYSFKPTTDAQMDGEGPHHVSAIGTLSTSYWFRHDSGVRFSWSRVATDDERDTDVFLVGLAYRF